MVGGGTIWIVPGVDRDRYGDPTGTADDEVAIEGAMWGPRSQRTAVPASIDVLDRDREGVLERLIVFVPDGQPLPKHTDALRIDGQVYKLDGNPGTWTNHMTGWRPGSVLTVWRTAG